MTFLDIIELYPVVDGERKRVLMFKIPAAVAGMPTEWKTRCYARSGESLIPLQQYKTAYELYEKGSDEVKYYFGSNDESFMDKVCCSEYPSSMFDTAKELGSTKGFFCGHDHYNNMSLEYEGIRLTYGMSIDYLAMPGIARDTKQRGATLITVHDDSEIDISQVPLSEIGKAGK